MEPFRTRGYVLGTTSRYIREGLPPVEVHDDRLACIMADIHGHEHLPPILTGWATFTLEATGKQLLSSKIWGWSVEKPDVDEATFELTWKA